MEVLLKKYGDEYYVWKEATYNQRKFFFTGTNTRIEQINILAIRNDDRKDCVECACCGEVIHNDPQSIEAHFIAQEAKRDCFHCDKLRTESRKLITAQYKKNESGSYTVTETSEAVLSCGQAYWNKPKIDSEGALSICKFTACRRAGVMEISDVFIKYPDLFDKQATVDALNENNSTYEGYKYGYFVYDLKCHNTVKAYVNPLGIIDHFVISYRSNAMNAFYSARYDKIFFEERFNKYAEDAPYNISDNRYNQAKAKISALYKEA